MIATLSQQTGQLPAPQAAVEWRECRFQGVLICLIDQANPNHIKVLNKSQGKKRWVELFSNDLGSAKVAQQ